MCFVVDMLFFDLVIEIREVLYFDIGNFFGPCFLAPSMLLLRSTWCGIVNLLVETAWSLVRSLYVPVDTLNITVSIVRMKHDETNWNWWNYLIISVSIPKNIDVSFSWQEECDDGNLDAFDGCDATCQVEPGFVCTGATGTAPSQLGNPGIGSELWTRNKKCCGSWWFRSLLFINQWNNYDITDKNSNLKL